MKRLPVSLLLFSVLFSLPVFADDWPLFAHDNQRSGVTAESLALPLNLQWQYKASQPPSPAWPPPAVADYWHRIQQVHPRLTFDRAFHPVVVGDRIYFGSSADDSVRALDVATGALAWSFFTSGPVRFAPAVVEGKLYAASDDGTAYCLDAATGALMWQYTPAHASRAIMGNGRLISAWPIRTGVSVFDGTAYFLAGLFPPEGVFLCALDAATGAERYIKRAEGVSPQGYLLTSATRLYVPTGRSTPAVFDRLTGERVASLEGTGGTYALLVDDELIYGPGPRGELTTAATAAPEQLVTFLGNRLIATPTLSYLQSASDLTALDRPRYVELQSRQEACRSRIKELMDQAAKAGRGSEEAKTIDAEIETLKKEVTQVVSGLRECVAWKKSCEERYDLILAGDTLYAGGDGQVATLSTKDGETLWTAPVEGKAYGLAVANGRLLVSTDTGVIHCFAAAENASPVTVEAEKTAFPSSASDPQCADAAQHALDEAGITQGLCLVLGSETGRLAYELAQRSELKIVCLEDDPAKAAALRKAFAGTKLYGTRIAVYPASLDKLPCADYLANWVVSERLVLGGSMPTPPDEVLRVLRPGGGVACLDTTVRRAPLEGAGMWTHQYADAANTASSGDTLTALPVRVQWFGEPGPRSMIDRHHRNIAPLSRDGRIFVPGDSLLFAIDAYNGTPLWQIELPDTRRMGAQRDASSHAVAEDLLYTPVGNACWALDVATGKRTAMFEAPQIVDGLALDWGYVATVDEGLFGSGRRHEARFTEISWQGDKEVQWGDYMRMVTSRSLFRMDRHSGEVQWTYTQGVIIQPTLTIGGGRVYFVESYSPKAIADEDGLIELATLFEQTPHLVALDERSGKPVYDCPVDLSVITHIVYQAYADEKLVITGSYNKNSRTWYQVFVFDAKTGSLLWTADHANNKEGLNGDHGEQVHHPVIAGGIIFAEPVAYDLQTGQRVNPGGQPVEWVMDGRGGCGTMSGSASYLYFRDGNPTMQSLDAQSVRTPLGQVSRPGCWINIIPACGIILVPEASAGCTCNFPIQTSIAFAPEARADK